jgi:hypothetical protein
VSAAAAAIRMTAIILPSVIWRIVSAFLSVDSQGELSPSSFLREKRALD